MHNPPDSEFRKKRLTHSVMVGSVGIGGDNPVRIQSMTNTDPLDIAATANQIASLTAAGAEIIRITIPSILAAQKLKDLKAALAESAINTPLVADIHFNPQAAVIAAEWVEKVRINPGNFAEKNIQTDSPAETIKKALSPLVEILKKQKKSLRIGVNHGSLSQRIIELFGNTVEGMVYSAMEYLFILKEMDFNQVVISMKSSNPMIMLNAYRLLAKEMKENSLTHPFHLGVTEAGSGIEGIIKSATGIGPLLYEGIGDTIRISLTEPPENEIEPAKSIIHNIQQLKSAEKYKLNIKFWQTDSYLPCDHSYPFLGYLDNYSECSVKINNQNGIITLKKNHPIEFKEPADKDHNNSPLLLTADEPGMLLKAEIIPSDKDIIIYYRNFRKDRLITLAIEFSTLISCSVNVKGIIFPEYSEELHNYLLTILQALRLRISKTEFISCPTCGRTSFDLFSLSKEVKEKLQHLKGLKIAVMGCIVNGPGEMADADYGCIGSGKNKVTIFRNKSAVKSVALADACDELIRLIKEDKKWRDP